jgi:hypothetical protein
MKSLPKQGLLLSDNILDQSAAINLTGWSFEGLDAL